jgi:hypothetical protein
MPECLTVRHSVSLVLKWTKISMPELVRCQKKEDQARYWNVPEPDGVIGFRKFDAGGIGLDADAQLCSASSKTQYTGLSH